MRYLSVCSGIEAATVAWHPLGWRPHAFSEIDKFPSALLAHYYPSVPNWGDMTRFKEWPDAAVDVLVGGTPCQAFSVAGLRKGLADPRGNLTLTYLALVARYRPRWVVWENVPGVLSDRTGAFGSLVGGLAELGYGWAYRVLDAQFFRVAQRRSRVFVVGSARGWAAAGAVLFERESLSGNPPPRREPGERAAPTLAARTRGGGGLGTDTELDGGLIPEVCGALTDGAHNGGGLNGQDAYTGRIIPVAFNARQDPDAWLDRTGPLDTDGSTQAVAFSCKDYGADAGDISPTLRAMGHTESHPNAGGQVAVARGLRVRRLTPRECERLQGFPDDYTLIPYRGRPAKDGPRYKAIGNSMARPVMAWIAGRIEQVEAIVERRAA